MLIGRRRESAVLVQAHAAAREGRSSGLVISGEAGIDPPAAADRFAVAAATRSVLCALGGRPVDRRSQLAAVVVSR